MTNTTTIILVLRRVVNQLVARQAASTPTMHDRQQGQRGKGAADVPYGTSRTWGSPTNRLESPTSLSSALGRPLDARLGR